jgi:multidrug efflux pump subunit AcrB
MAFAVMGGMLVASLLTLIFLPALYVTWFGGAEKAPSTASTA